MELSDDGRQCLFPKSATEVICIAVAEWKGQQRLDVRTYVPEVEGEGLIATKKGVSLPLDLYDKVLEAVRRLGDVMGPEKVVAVIPRSEGEQVRIGVTLFKGHPLIYVRTFVDASSEWIATQKGISLRVDLYPTLLEALEVLRPAVDAAREKPGEGR